MLRWNLGVIVSDKGSQLVCGSHTVTWSEKENTVHCDRDEIACDSEVLEWRFVPMGCQHNNGLA